MSDFTIEQLEALKEGTIPGPWAAITDYPYISIVIADDDDQIHAPIVDIKDGTTDEPEVGKNHELMAAAPALVDALIAEKRAHQKLRAGIEELRAECKTIVDDNGKGHESYEPNDVAALIEECHYNALTCILEADNE